MSSTMSRFIGVSSISTLPNLNSRYLASTSTSASASASYASLAYNKDLIASRKVHGFTGSSLQYDPMMRISRRLFVVRSNITPPPGAPLPSGSPSGSMRNWIVGIVLTFVLPFFTHKWGPLQVLKNKVDTAVNTVEHIVESIEDVAHKVDDMIDDFTDNLPEDSKLRKSMEAFDEVVERVEKAAHVADDIIDKMQEVEDKLEATILDEAKQKEVYKQVAKEEEIRLQVAKEEEIRLEENQKQ